MNWQHLFTRAFWAATLASLCLPGAVLAQANLRELPPDLAEQLTTERILQACAANQADTLPSPFPDVVPTDWAYKAVLTLYYCGAYRGAIPPEQFRRYLEQQRGSQT
ncbi:hypothetical protein [Synechococcus sp. W70.1]|jgi:hypothetical protein|uniref:hypothetical protein n=1 Tax=unclassified Synechococcus TaxID=2626047 RepID=UPI0039C29F7C